ncbi:hypothetical protein ACWDKQ_26460 [Saccharopolyspora sp. NPDC000995]
MLRAYARLDVLSGGLDSEVHDLGTTNVESMSRCAGCWHASAVAKPCTTSRFQASTSGADLAPAAVELVLRDEVVLGRVLQRCAMRRERDWCSCRGGWSRC